MYNVWKIAQSKIQKPATKFINTFIIYVVLTFALFFYFLHFLRVCLMFVSVIIFIVCCSDFRNAMLERDNAEDFIHDIVDEVLGNTMDGIFKIYIERQLLPFTITQAKDAILQIIEVYITVIVNVSLT